MFELQNANDTGRKVPSQTCSKHWKGRFDLRVLREPSPGKRWNVATVTSQGVSAVADWKIDTLKCCKHHGEDTAANTRSISKGSQTYGNELLQRHQYLWEPSRQKHESNEQTHQALLFFFQIHMYDVAHGLSGDLSPFFLVLTMRQNEHQKRLRRIGVTTQDLAGLATDSVFVPSGALT